MELLAWKPANPVSLIFTRFINELEGLFKVTAIKVSFGLFCTRFYYSLVEPKSKIIIWACFICSIWCIDSRLIVNYAVCQRIKLHFLLFFIAFYMAMTFLRSISCNVITPVGKWVCCITIPWGRFSVIVSIHWLNRYYFIFQKYWNKFLW